MSHPPLTHAIPATTNTALTPSSHPHRATKPSSRIPDEVDATYPASAPALHRELEAISARAALLLQGSGELVGVELTETGVSKELVRELVEIERRARGYLEVARGMDAGGKGGKWTGLGGGAGVSSGSLVPGLKGKGSSGGIEGAEMEEMVVMPQLPQRVPQPVGKRPVPRFDPGRERKGGEDRDVYAGVGKKMKADH